MTLQQDSQKYRPHLHFAPKEKWMNDPNGLVYFEEEYHLFFQHNPYDNIWGPMHWGHAVSEDMTNWKELDIALYPDEHGTIFSGSAIVDWHNTSGFFDDKPGLVAIFTHHLEEAGKPVKQSQSLAYSHDNGRTWTKYKKNPVLEHEFKEDFRDPKVFWYEDADQWIMVLATGQTISFYSSQNLINWELESEFGKDIESYNGVWECPDLLKLNVEDSQESKWVLFVSIGDNPEMNTGSQMRYFIGSFNGSEFIPDDDESKVLDFGKDNYAGVSFSNIPESDGREIYVGWMNNWQYANDLPTEGWKSQMILPRELALRKRNQNYYVVQRPVRELNRHFTKRKEIDDILVSKDKEKKINIDVSYADINLEIEPSEETPDHYGFVVHHAKNQLSKIIINPKSKLLVLDRSESGEIEFSNAFQDNQKIELHEVENLKIRLLIDSSSLELFIDDGLYALTSLVFPDKTCEAISFFTSDSSVKIKEGYIAT